MHAEIKHMKASATDNWKKTQKEAKKNKELGQRQTETETDGDTQQDMKKELSTVGAKKGDKNKTNAEDAVSAFSCIEVYIHRSSNP